MHILWIKTEFLHPLDKGGRIRSYQMLRHLRSAHRITYLTLDDGTAGDDIVALAREYAHQVIRVPFRSSGKRTPRFYGELVRNLVSRLPYAVAKYRVPALQRAITDAVRQQRVDVVVCDFLAPSINVPARLGVPAILFEHNVEASIWERHSRVAKGPVRSLYMREQWRRMRAFERRECRRFDHVVAVSEDDCRELERAYGLHQVSSVPTGVDTQFFRPSGDVSRVPGQMVFTGSMDWMPNEDALAWFCAEVLPLVQRDVPGASLFAVGRSPSNAVRSLADRYANVTVTGSVPDVRPYMERASVFVVPLRVGGGTRLKIFEAMGMEVPVVSTSIGAEGLPVRDGVECLIADGAKAFAAAVVRILRDPSTARQLASNAAARVRSEFGWNEAAARFASTCERVINQHRAGGAGVRATEQESAAQAPDLAPHSPSS